MAGPPEMEPWTTVSRETVFAGSRFLSVERHAVRLPDGRVIRDWPWIVAPDFVLVAAVDRQGRFLCFRQTKYAVEGTTWAPVGGYLDPGEDPESAARRELAEETGCEADRMVSLGRYAADANRGAGNAHLFLASGVRRVRPPVADDLEEQRLVRMRREEVREALDRHEFKSLGWVALMEAALRRTAGGAGAGSRAG